MIKMDANLEKNLENLLNKLILEIESKEVKINNSVIDDNTYNLPGFNIGFNLGFIAALKQVIQIIHNESK